MRVVAVPVKPLQNAKTRLAGVLNADERAALALAMLDDVLAATVEQAGWETWVISRDRRVLDRAGAAGARPVREPGTSLLAAVAHTESLLGNADELAVVLADLPFATRESIAFVLASPGDVVAVASHSDGGTNVLVRRPPSVMRARFGKRSFAEHCTEGIRAGVALGTVRSTELAFDVDRPEDLTTVLVSGPLSRTRALCRDLGVDARLHARA